MNEKILIVDDEEDILIMLKQFLTIQGYLVYTATNSEQAIGLLDKSPNLLLLDINMPGMNGIELCKKIRNHVRVPIIFVTALVGEEDRIKGLMIGGDDYITKPFSLKELGARIAAHLRREERKNQKDRVSFLGDLIVEYAERKVYYCTSDKKDADTKEQEIKFTKTEFDIIEILSLNSGQVFDKEAIYEKLWGFDKDGDSSIITEHVRRIRSKLNKYIDHDLIETVWGVGYRWVG